MALANKIRGFFSTNFGIFGIFLQVFTNFWKFFISLFTSFFLQIFLDVILFLYKMCFTKWENGHHGRRLAEKIWHEKWWCSEKNISDRMFRKNSFSFFPLNVWEMNFLMVYSELECCVTFLWSSILQDDYPMIIRWYPESAPKSN